jgi:hypothetical protein
MTEEFEYEGVLGKFKAKGKGALILSAAGAVVIAGGTLLLLTKNKEVLLLGKNLATKGLDLIKYN